MTDFTHSLDNLISILKAKKDKIKKCLKQHFKIDVHYIIQKNNILKKHGGHNKETILLKEDVYELILNTYNLKNRYITKVNNMNIVCNIVQYTLISILANNLYNIDDLIKYVVNKNSNIVDNSIYLQSYIENLLKTVNELWNCNGEKDRNFKSI